MNDLELIKAALEKAVVIFGPGLTDDEVARIETTHRFTFPPDLRAFLQYALPVSEGFVNWRKEDDDYIAEYLAWPYSSMCVDIQNNAFWPKAWGEKPVVEDEAYETARKAVEAAPTLIPVCGQRFMADRPCEEGTPVFSVRGADVVYYGATLEDYLENEFHEAFGRENFVITGEPKQVEFWSAIAEKNSVF